MDRIYKKELSDRAFALWALVPLIDFALVMITVLLFLGVMSLEGEASLPALETAAGILILILVLAEGMLALLALAAPFIIVINTVQNWKTANEKSRGFLTGAKFRLAVGIVELFMMFVLPGLIDIFINRLVFA